VLLCSTCRAAMTLESSMECLRTNEVWLAVGRTSKRVHVPEPSSKAIALCRKGTVLTSWCTALLPGTTIASTMDAPPVQYVTTSDGYDIAYAVSGEGPLLIHVPGLWSHFSRLWSHLYFEAIAARFRLVLYDGRGQGLSTRGLPESLAMADYTRDLEAIIERLGARQFVLWGYGFGAEVAIQYAVDHPDQVQAILLWNYSDLHRSATSETMVTMARQDWKMFVGTVARTGFPHLDPERAITLLFDCMSQEDHVRQALAIRKVSGESLLRQVKVPTLFLTSRSGAWAHEMQALAQRLASKSQNFRLFSFDGYPISDASMLAAVEFVGAVEVDQGDGLRPDRSYDAQLSHREVEVLRLIAAGKSNQQIADALVISLSTVLHHVTNILTKTGCSNRTEAAIYARDRGPG
jgi:DNA-binding CsgD family transcriptional regulator/pimeloyl-ACP methyl ester carboxylesterase